MKAAMDANGVITLRAETQLESFALGQWVSIAFVDMVDPVSKQREGMVRQRFILIDASVPSE